MADYSNLLATIAANIYTNGNQEVTAAMVKTAADSIVASLGTGSQFMGVAHPSDTPSGYADLRAFWIAFETGTYTNFGGQVLTDGEVAVISYDGNGWAKNTISIANPQVINADGSIDLAFVDDNGLAIGVFRNGHIKTKNFDSSKVGVLVDGSDIFDFQIIDESKDYAIIAVDNGYPKTKNFNGEKVAKVANIVDTMEIYETTIVNIADYGNNLLNVYAAIHPSKTHRYTILIPEGVYDVESWFTPQQIASDSSDFRGVELLNYTKLLGVGCADKIILQWINESYPYRQYISTLNTHEWNELENLTIKAKDIRYAVHDDIWNGLDRHIRVKNCAFIVSGVTTRAWGAGCNGGYDGEFINSKFIMEDSTPAPSGTYVEPFVLHDNLYNTRGDSHLTFINCRFVTPYTSYHQPLDHNSWDAVAYNNSYPLYDPEKRDYAVGDFVNMPGDTGNSYECLVANTQVMPYGEGRPSLNIGFGAEGATQPLYVTLIGCYLSTYMAVTPTLVRVTGFGNKSDKTPIAILWDESSDSIDEIIDLI